jgi:glycopeptide antibiotics resistance protein
MVWYFGGNTLLFLPMGFLFSYLTNSVRHTLYMGLFMGTVEIIQGLTGLGVCDIDDC